MEWSNMPLIYFSLWGFTISCLPYESLKDKSLASCAFQFAPELEFVTKVATWHDNVIPFQLIGK